MKSKTTGFKRIINATRYSWQGICSAFKHEAAFRQELILFGVLAPCSFWLDVTHVERVLMIASLLLIMLVELLNSAIEAVVDRIGEERHELAGRAKDTASAAVFIALALAVFVWLSFIFG